MGMIILIRNFLQDPRLKGVDVDSDVFLKIHHQILNEKRMMHDVFSEFYQACINLDKKYFSGEGQCVEIGAGVSFFKKQHPEIISTDIKEAENLDRVIDALDMDFEDHSIRAIYGINCFHHFPDPDKFFRELNRVLVKGGGCVLIEPYYGFLAKHFYKQLFDTETFNVSQQDWRNPDNQVMTGANQALSYIVFKRDYKIFVLKYPGLEIVYHKPLGNYIRYLLSGGLNFRSLLPGWSSPVLKFFEFCISPLNRYFGLHHVIVIRKINN
jgi:SAM-dependent methyltransferase